MAGISDLLAEQGRVRADAVRRRGERSGATIANLGQIPGAILADRRAAQAQQIALQRQQAQDTRIAGQDARADAQNSREQASFEAEQEAAHRAALAEGALKVRAAGYDPQIAQQWLSDAHARKLLTPEEAQNLLQQAQNPDGLKRIVDFIAPPQPKPSLRNVNPGDSVIDENNPSAGPVYTAPPKLEPPPKLTFSQPQPLMVNGRRVLTRAGSDGAIYDMQGQKIVNAEPDRPPSSAQGPQPAWQWVVRNGKEVYTNRVNDGDKPQNARVKATEDERKTAGFYGQMSDAISILDELEPSLSEKELYQIQTLPQEGLIGMANRGQLSEAAKRYIRAFEQFTEARLRPVSGAAISDSEFARDRRTYARQFSETPKLSTDRKTARNRALDSLKKRAGVALDDGNQDKVDAPTSTGAPSAPPGWKYVPKPGGGWTAVEDK